MLAILYALGMFVADLFKLHSRLEAENVFLRHQLALALRQKPRVRLRRSDRALLVWMVRLWPSLLDTVQVVRLKQSFVGTALELGPSGGGNLGIRQGGQRSIESFAN